MNLACGTSKIVELPDAGGQSCCLGAAVYGAQRCTCWAPVFDVEQQEVVEGEAHPRVEMCGDCAFRRDSPERQGDTRFANSSAGELEELVASDGPFFCHVGMRRVVALVHPSGARVEIPPGDYRPLIRDGRAYKADGTPADWCAGLIAMRASRR